MGYRAPRLYAVPVAHAYSSMNDSTSYYYGHTGMGASTTVGNHFIKIPRTGIIRGASVIIYCTVGSNEDVSVYALNSTTSGESLIGTVNMDVTPVWAVNDNLNIPININDNIGIRVLTPAWAVNPTGISGKGYILIETS